MSDKLSVANCVTLQLNFQTRLETDLGNFSQIFTTETDMHLASSLLQELEEEFHEARDRHSRITLSTSKVAKSYVEDDIFSKIRANYHKLWSRFRSKVPENAHSSFDLNSTQISMHPQCTSHTELKLPKIELPPFDGTFENWLAFNNMFTATVHNNTQMNPVVKLQRLLGAVKGEAAEIVKNLQLNEANYTLARSLLANRYQHTRRLVNSYLKKIYDIPAFKTESSKSLKSMLNIVNDCTSALRQLELPIEDYQLVYHLCRKLPVDVLSAWEREQGTSTELPSYSSFLSFLETRLRMVEMIEPAEKSHKSFHINSEKAQKVPHANPNRNKKNEVQQKKSNSTGRSKWTEPRKKLCSMCEGEHKLWKCEQFLKLSQGDRYKKVISSNVCKNCLDNSHTVDSCWSHSSCRVCNNKHHTLLHRYDPSAPAMHPQPTTSTQTFHTKSQNEHGTLLGTAQLHALNPSGSSLIIRALIDPCSEDSYIISSLAQSLRLKKYFSPSTIGVLGEENASSCSHRVNVLLKSMDNQFEMEISAGVVDKITSNLPAVHLSTETFHHVNNLKLADVSFNEPNKVHMLLGVDVHTKIRLDQSLRLSSNLIAENTLLGYLIRGKAPVSSGASSNVFMTKSSAAQLNLQIQKFWATEEINTKAHFHPDDALCEDIFVNSISKDSEGFLIMDLPFKDNTCPDIGPSRNMAIKRFLSLERKLNSNNTLKNEYHKTIHTYIQSNYLMKVPNSIGSNPKEYYLPHHAVVKESSSTTKVRVVFDASCRSMDGTSLNNHLLTGAKLQKDIRDIIFNWRQYRFSLTADIEKMYLMFKISPMHHNYQKIVWRFNENEPIEDYILTRATFGTSCAPFLAMRSLQYIAELHEQTDPIASKALRTEFYVDDFLSGGFTIDEALEKQTELRKVLNKYHLSIRKWSSNEDQTLLNVPETLLDSSPEIIFDETEFKKTLGIYWAKDKDAFFFSITPVHESFIFTKRQILSTIARLYDPLGWVSPCTMLAKQLMQKIWQTKTDWDEIVADSIKSEFQVFLNELPLLRKISIPRWTHVINDSSTLTIFGFSDASDKGYSAVVYLLNPETSIPNHPLILLTSKTKVADLKFQSTARLELNGAVLLSELLKWTVQLYSPRKVEVLAFSDSKIVLAWLNAHPSKWKTYVANRTSQILEWMKASQWHYIDTKMNPADCASRGLLPSELITHNLWLHGPSPTDLSFENIEPLDANQNTILNDSIKKSSIVLHAVNSSNVSLLLSKFSTHSKLLRVITRISNFIRNTICSVLKELHNNQSKILKYEKFDKILRIFSDPELVIFRCIQSFHYADELKYLRSQKELPRDSKIKSLSPFIDGAGILRVGGRLENANLTFDQKHPIILPRKHQVVTNLIRLAHEKTLHGSELLTLAYLQNRFYIPRATEKVRNYIHRCIVCFRYARHQQEVLMGTLPSDRVNFSRPFQHSGVDYAGPLTLKAYPGRCKKFLKGYVALFVCLCTKAIHLEIVSDLSSPAFLAAFKRFVGRRGRVHRMYSDNGTNFVGAKKILQNDIKLAEKTWKQDLNVEFKDLGTEWHFIPPATPNFGGLWEAGVKSIKTHLNKTIGTSFLTYEELSTVLIQIEAVLNSRPLCPLSNNPGETNFLTPSHFLIGETLSAPPERNYEMDRKSHLERWNHVQLTYQRFAHLWKRDYLNKLQNRPKCLKTTTLFKKGDLVLLAEDNTPPTVWPKMIVDEVHPGPDGNVRVVTLRNSSGKLLKRPVIKLRRLPCETNESS